jgi:F-type H+-transporting ATPase subunit b
MFSDPTFWVALGLFSFLALIAKPTLKFITSGLDSRAEKIKEELDEAERLRNDAQDLLAQYQRKQRDAAKEVEAIISHAKEEAERMDREGRARLTASLERREKLAMERIDLAEQQAVQKVRAHAIDVAVAAAEAVLSKEITAQKSNALVASAIKELPSRLH